MYPARYIVKTHIHIEELGYSSVGTQGEKPLHVCQATYTEHHSSGALGLLWYHEGGDVKYSRRERLEGKSHDGAEQAFQSIERDARLIFLGAHAVRLYS